jgi:hypothetical protein
MSANIFCVECGARPFPELALPEIVREDFDLLKIRGDYRCREHRDAAIATKAKPATKWDKLESQLVELGRFVADMELNENDRATALELIDRADDIIARLRRS